LTGDCGAEKTPNVGDHTIFPLMTTEWRHDRNHSRLPALVLSYRLPVIPSPGRGPTVSANQPSARELWAAFSLCAGMQRFLIYLATMFTLSVAIVVLAFLTMRPHLLLLAYVALRIW
jgi:hypothetical protein